MPNYSRKGFDHSDFFFRLIEEVGKRPSLVQGVNFNGKYSGLLKEDEWNDIAKKMNRHKAILQLRWYNLKARYNLELENQLSHVNGKETYNGKWKYFSKMHFFLRNTRTTKRRFPVAEHEDEEEETVDKNEASMLNQNSENPQDEVHVKLENQEQDSEIQTFSFCTNKVATVLEPDNPVIVDDQNMDVDEASTTTLQNNGKKHQLKIKDSPKLEECQAEQRVPIKFEFEGEVNALEETALEQNETIKDDDLWEEENKASTTENTILDDDEEIQAPSSTNEQPEIEPANIIPMNDDVHFLVSLIPFMNKLNPIKKLSIRNEIQNLLLKEMLCDSCKAGNSATYCSCE